MIYLVFLGVNMDKIYIPMLERRGEDLSNSNSILFGIEDIRRQLTNSKQCLGELKKKDGKWTYIDFIPEGHYKTACKEYSKDNVFRDGVYYNVYNNPVLEVSYNKIRGEIELISLSTQRIMEFLENIPQIPEDTRIGGYINTARYTTVEKLCEIFPEDDVYDSVFNLTKKGEIAVKDNIIFDSRLSHIIDITSSTKKKWKKFKMKIEDIIEKEKGTEMRLNKIDFIKNEILGEVI